MPYIYILSNEAMPGLVKIGSTALPPEERAKQLSTTGVPQPFIVEEYWEQECVDILVLERKIHSHLKQWRMASNREFFSLSTDKAIDKVNNYFQLMGELEKKREEEKKTAKVKKENLKRVATLRKQLDEIVIGQRKEIVDAFKEDSQCISDYLSSVANPHMAASTVRRKRPDDSLGKLREAHGWFVSVESERRSNRRRKNYDDGGEIVRFFISVSFSSFMKGVNAAPQYISVSYYLRTGDLTSRNKDRNIINSYFGEGVIPDSLGGLLKNAGAKGVYDVWSSAYGQASRLKKVVDEESICPVCYEGKLVRRTRRKDGHPFLGCSNFPHCKFAYNYLPALLIDDWVEPGYRCDNNVGVENKSSTNKGVDGLDDLDDIFDSVSSESKVKDNNNEEVVRYHKESGGFSWWYLLWGYLAIKFVFLLVKEAS